MTHCHRYVTAALILAACADGSTGPGTRLVLRAPSGELAEGGRLTLVVEAAGRPVDPRDVEWVSRDAAVASVSGGVVTGIGPGVTHVVARVGAARDSIRLTVRFADLGPGRTGVRLSTTGGGAQPDQTFRLNGLGLVHRIASSPRDYSWIHASSRDVASAAGDDLFAGDTLLVVNFRGTPAPGSVAVVPPTISTGADGFGIGGDSAVYMQIADPDGSYRFYVAVTPATLELTTVELPGQPGRVPGRVAGRVSFQAAGLRLTFGDRGAQTVTPLGDQTVQVYAEFVSPLYHILTSYVSGTVAGQPYADTLFRLGGWAAMTGDTLQVFANGLMNRTVDTPTYLRIEASIPAPRLGDFALAPDAATRVRVAFAPLYRAGPGEGGQIGQLVTGVPASGTLSITEFRAPTDDAYGLMVGRIDATLAFDPTLPNHSATVATRWLLMAIEPLRGPPFR